MEFLFTLGSKSNVALELPSILQHRQSIGRAGNSTLGRVNP